MRPRNVVLLTSHDTGRLVQPYGYDCPAPHIQQLANEGVLFRQNFCNAPTCSPSRACLLTGTHAHVNGMFGLAHLGFSMNDYGRHLLRLLQVHGYQTALAGIQHIIAHFRRKQLGYDVIVGDGLNQGLEEAQAYLSDSRRLREPFYLEIGLFETHREFPRHAPDESLVRGRPPEPLPDTAEVREDMADFRTAVRMLDQKVGTIDRLLRERGLAERTLFICATDHGPPFPRMKCDLTDGGLGAMLILRGPGEFHGGRTIDAMTQHLDLFPTLCEYLGIMPPAWLQGKSLLPLLRGEAAEVHAEIFAEVNYHAAYEPMRCVRTRRHKYIRRFHDYPRAILPNCDDSPSKELWLRAGWAERMVAREELYDLVLDPHEMCNLANDPSAQVAREEMRQRLRKFMDETGDPLREGPIALPPGAKVLSPDRISAGELDTDGCWSATPPV